MDEMAFLNLLFDRVIKLNHNFESKCFDKK